MFPHGLPRVPESRAVNVGQDNVSIVKAAIRLMELMAKPGDAELLAPAELAHMSVSSFHQHFKAVTSICLREAIVWLQPLPEPSFPEHMFLGKECQC